MNKKPNIFSIILMPYRAQQTIKEKVNILFFHINLFSPLVPGPFIKRPPLLTAGIFHGYDSPNWKIRN